MSVNPSGDWFLEVVMPLLPVALFVYLVVRTVIEQ